MSRGAVIATAMIAVALVGAFLFLHRSHAPRRPAAAASHAAAAAAAPTSLRPTAPTSLPEAPTLAMIQSDGERAARLWLSRANAVALAAKTKKFGAEVADLSEQPPDRAWPALTRLARNGDAAALAMAMQIGVECRNADATLRALNRHPHANVAEIAYRDLSPSWKSFIDALATLQQDREHERLARCTNVDGVLDFAWMMFERFFTPGNAEAQLAIAADLENDDDAIAEMRKLAGEIGTLDARRSLAERLIRAQSVDYQTEGEATLELLADGDAASASLLASCYAHGCGGFHARPDEADAWIEHAAADGDAAALHDRIARLESAGKTGEAWAWSLYGLELARSGCLERETPTYVAIAQSASDEERVRAALGPAQQNAGRALAYELAARWGIATKQRLGCSG